MHGSYDTPILLQKDIKERQYGGISHKEGNRTEESHLISLKEDYYSNILMFWRPNIWRTISSTNGTIDPSDSRQDLCLTMDPNTRGKVEIKMDGYADTSIATVENGLVANAGVSIIMIGHVEVLSTERKVTLIGSDHDLSKKFTLIGVSTTAIDLPYGVIFTCLNKDLLPHRGDNSLLFISQACEFWMAVNDVAKNCIISQYFHAGD